MAPAVTWADLGIPYPEGMASPRPPVAPVPTMPVRTRLGWAPIADPVQVTYAPCPSGCGRPTCCLAGDTIPPCLGCQAGNHVAATPDLATVIAFPCRPEPEAEIS